jgi:hypothetical protein
MSIGNWNLQWLNHNSQRSYPLTDWATKYDTTKTIKMPDSFILALYLPIASGAAVDAKNFFISKLTIATTGFVVVLSYTDGASVVDVAAATIAKSAHAPNQSYAVGGIGNFDDSVGQIVVGNLDEISALPAGMYTFNYADGAIETDAIRPMLRAVNRLRVYNNNEYSDYIYGDVTLVAGVNIKIDVATVEDTTEITINAISDAGLNQECICATQREGTCIKCINGVCSEDGNFTFANDACVTIEAIPGGLTFSDTCATPCCGCAELDAVTSQINRFGDGVASLQNFVTRLNAEVAQMSFVVLANKIGTGCG